MIVKREQCILAPIDCNKISSCKYMLHRFGVLECEPVKYKRLLVDLKHQQELKKRRELLEKLQNDKKV